MERPPRVSHSAYFSPCIQRARTINCQEPSVHSFTCLGAERRKVPAHAHPEDSLPPTTTAPPQPGYHPPRVIRPAHRLIHPLTHIQKFAEYPVPLGLCTSHAWSSMGEAQAHPDDSDTREANERPAKAVGQDGGGALNVGVKRRDAAGLGLEGWPSGRLAKEPREAGRRASCSVRRARAQVCSAVHGSSFPQESLRWGAQCRALRASSCRERKPDLRGPSIGRQVI